MPVLSVHVENYPEDPTGATLAFKLVELFTDVVKTTTGTPTVANIASVTNDGTTTYDFDLKMTWAVADLDTAGLYYGRFVLTTAGGSKSVPSGRDFTIEVMAAPELA